MSKVNNYSYRVLHVVNSMNPKEGGVCQAIRLLISSLNNSVVYNEVISLDDPSSDFGTIDSFVNIKLGKGRGPWSYNPNLIPWFRLNATSYDVIILHGLWLFIGYAIFLSRKKLFKKKNNEVIPKLFIMPHGMMDPYFQNSSDRKLKSIRNWIYWKLLESRVVQSSECILFTCHKEMELAKLPFKPYKPKKEVIIGLGIANPPVMATNNTYSEEPELFHQKDEPYILFLSRIDKKKGLLILIKAYSAVSKMANLPKLVIAGPGHQTKFGLEICKLVQDEELENKILFSDMLIGDDKWQAIFNSEAVILPSHQENFGIVVVEALACHKPVLITNKINIYKEIQDYNCGLIVDDSQEGIQRLLLRWHSLNSLQKDKMSFNARQCFEANFLIDKVSDNLKQVIYNEL